MTDGRKRSTAGFWATVVGLLPVLYVVSFGPACWIASRVETHKLHSAYTPLAYVLIDAPSPIRNVFVWFGGIGMATRDDGAAVRLPTEGPFYAYIVKVRGMVTLHSSEALPADLL